MKNKARDLILVFWAMLWSASVGAADFEWGPFLQTLSAPAQKHFQSAAVGRRLSDLPLYQMDMHLNVVMGSYRLHWTLDYQNHTGQPLPDLVLRVFANAGRASAGAEAHIDLFDFTLDGASVKAQQLHATAWRIVLPSPLAPGARVSLSLQCRGKIPRLAAAQAGAADPMAELLGVPGPGAYGAFGQREGVFNLGHFFPVLPARHDQQWDISPPAAVGDPAHFELANVMLKLRLPKTVQLASSGEQVGEQALGPLPADEKEVYLLGAALRNFALQLSTRYVAHEKTVAGVRLRVCLVDDDPALAKKMLAQAAAALLCYQGLFGPYPYAELEVAEAPLKSGAAGMEYPGLVTVASSVIAPKAAGPMAALMTGWLDSTATLEFVLAHEVAHQWFHVLVGSDSGRHPFLDEALANYAATLYFEKQHGPRAAAGQRKWQMELPYQLLRLLGQPDGVVLRPAKDFENQLAYAALVYGKGALFFSAARKLLGKRALVRALRQYTQRYAFAQARPEDLLAQLQAAGKTAKQVKDLWQRWLQESHGDEDIGTLQLGDLAGMLGKIPAGSQVGPAAATGMDPATLRLFQQAVRQISGGP